MHSLVSGGAGFIGSHLVDALLDAGDRVTVLDNMVTGKVGNLAHRIGDGALTVVEADIVAPLPRLPEPVDRVYHLASPASPVDYGRHPVATLMVNSEGTRRLLDLAERDGARFLLASTSEVYGDPQVHPQPETYWGNVNPVGPRSCYDEGKRFAESLTVWRGRGGRPDVRLARIFNTYGPRSNPGDGRVVPNFCVQALAGDPLTIYGDGRQTRSLCYVDDLVRGLVLLMETDGLAGAVVNLGSAQEVTVADLAKRIAAVAGTPARVIYQPLPEEDPTRRCPDIAKAERLLGWQPTVELDDGLERTLAFFRLELAGLATAVPAW